MLETTTRLATATSSRPKSAHRVIEEIEPWKNSTRVRTAREFKKYGQQVRKDVKGLRAQEGPAKSTRTD